MASREDRTGTCEASCASLVYPLLASTASCTFWIRIWPATYPDPDYNNSDVFHFMRVEFRVVPLRWPAQICRLCNLECQSFGCSIYTSYTLARRHISSFYMCFQLGDHPSQAWWSWKLSRRWDGHLHKLQLLWYWSVYSWEWD